MMTMPKLRSLLQVAEIERADGVPNSDDFVARKLKDDKAKRVDLLARIKGEAEMVDMVFELEAEIASIDHALTAYPELAAA